MRTLFLGATGGDLASEAAVAEALSAFPSSPPVLQGIRPSRLARAFPGLRAVLGLEELGRQDFARAVLVGPQRDEASWLSSLSLLGRLAAAGAEVHVHNLGLSEFPAMLDPPTEARAVLAAAGRFSVRDHATQDFVLSWQIGRIPLLAAYPEAWLSPDPALSTELRGRPLFGLSLGAWRDPRGLRRGAIGRVPGLAARLAGHALLPLPAEPEAVREAGALAGLLETLGAPPMPLALPLAADRAGWMERITPARLAALVAACDVVLTETDLVAAFAARARVPCIGLSGVQGNTVHR
ncbi:MAG: hypothetical protein NZM27_09820 [Acetobacteraceae bacterium]|nr:hypothetical protein [Acetobacteraceae bacterium]